MPFFVLHPSSPQLSCCNHRTFIGPKSSFLVSEMWMVKIGCKNHCISPAMWPLYMYSRQGRFIWPHLCLMLDTHASLTTFVFHFTVKEMHCPGSQENREMNLYPLSFAMNFSSLSVLKTEFPGLEFYTRILSSALFSTSLIPTGSLSPNQNSFQVARATFQSSYKILEIFPSFLDFPAPTLVRGHGFRGALTGSVVPGPPP